MNNKINLDDLLKEEMGNLSPEPPANLWQNISSKLPDVATTSSTTTAAAKTVVGVSVKSAVIAVATIAAGAVGYVLYTSSNNKPSNNTQNSTVNETQYEVKTGDKNQIAEEVTLTKQTAVLPETTSTKKHKKVKNKIIARGDFPEEEVSVDFSAPTSTQNNKKLLQNEEVVSVTADQQNTKTNTEDLQQENTHVPNSSITPNTASEEFLKPNIPNVFTPNNDGYNDEFVITIENEVLYDLKITDAKGNVIFESKDKNKHWNGTNQKSGEYCEPGVYVMAFRYQLNGMKEPKVEKGLILLKL